jgi:hypothetical protein
VRRPPARYAGGRRGVEIGGVVVGLAPNRRPAHATRVVVPATGREDQQELLPSGRRPLAARAEQAARLEFLETFRHERQCSRAARFSQAGSGPLRGYGRPLPDSPSRRTISRTIGRNSMMAKNSVASQMSRRRNRTLANSKEGSAPLPEIPPKTGSAGQARARTRNC